MKMSLPQTISGWCMWLFFLFVGLGMFVPILATLAPWLASLTPSSASLGCNRNMLFKEQPPQ